jgi:2,5-furandicarboxylate decarboxylase 1
MQGSKLDPSTENGVGAKLGIDATIPTDAPEMRYKRIRVPGENTINLANLLAPDISDWRATWPGYAVESSTMA